MEVEWLFADVTPVGSHDSAERSILRMILGIFWPIMAAFVAGEPVCDVETPLLIPNTFT